jgi:hypothetical protein
VEHGEQPAEARVDRGDLHGVKQHAEAAHHRLEDDEAHGEERQPAQPLADLGAPDPAARRRVRNVIIPALSRCECSANMAMFVSHPFGLSDPFESGQSGKAIPAPMLVVKAPSATRTNTHAAVRAENTASPGLWPGARLEGSTVSMTGENDGRR